MAASKITCVSRGGLVDLSNKEIDILGDIHGFNRPNVKKLYLYHNHIKKIENLNGATFLVELNLSANLITEISGLGYLINLHNLDLSLNKISKIENLDQLVRLQELNLSGNRINEITGLSTLVNLQLLNLSKNQIQGIQNLESLTEMKELNLGSNKITTWQNLPALANLKHLDISGNGLTTMVDSPQLPALIKLQLQDNMISILGLPYKYDKYADYYEVPVYNWANLEELWLSNNLIDDWAQLSQLQRSPKLQSIYLKDNPIVCSERGQVMYSLWVRNHLPQVTSIDGYKIQM